MINPRAYIPAYDRPLVWYMNINQEQLWNTSDEFPSITDHHQLELVKQQEQQMICLAEPSDTLVFHHHPDAAFLDYLQSEGFKLPEIHVLDDKETLASWPQKDAMLVPYIKTEEMMDQVASWSNARVFGGEPGIVKQINNKFWLRKFMEENGFQTTSGFFCSTVEELRQAYTTLRAAGFQKCVLKIPFGSSGKGLKIIEEEVFFQLLVKYIARRKTKFELLIEGWHPIKRHINGQMWVSPSKVELLAVTEQDIDTNGVYSGTCFTAHFEEDVLKHYRENLLRLGQRLREAGYIGFCGVDSILGQDHILYPAVEVNARFTHVTYLLPWTNKLSREYSHVNSRLIRWETVSEHDFTAWFKALGKLLQPDQNNGFKIYTFARHSPLEQARAIYRMGILCYGRDAAKVQDMLQKLNSIARNWEAEDEAYKTPVPD